jgi:hypothetical protein
MRNQIVLAVICPLLALLSCRVPHRHLVGSYKSDKGDSLVLTQDHFFRVETTQPDTSIRLFRMSSGRWYRTRRRLYLTMDSKSMGMYWSCAPFRIGIRKLTRNDTCAGSKRIAFTKIIVKPQRLEDLKNKKEAEKKKKKEEKREQENREQENREQGKRK